MLLYEASSVYAAKYLTAIALTVSLWDHALTFGREVQLLWRAPWPPSQLLLLVNRYGAELSMIFIAINVGSFVPSVTDAVCEAVAVLITVYCVINSASSQFALLIHLHKLFDARSLYRRALVVGFVACFSVSITFGILNVRQTFDVIRHAPRSFCVGSLSHKFEIGMWGGMAAYDAYVFVLLLINAMHAPRRSDSEIVVRLLREGALVFLACSALRVSQLVSSILTVGAQTLVVPLVAWSIDGILTFRLLLKAKAVETVREGQIARLVNLQDASSIQMYHEVHVEMR